MLLPSLLQDSVPESCLERKPFPGCSGAVLTVSMLQILRCRTLSAQPKPTPRRRLEWPQEAELCLGTSLMPKHGHVCVLRPAGSSTAQWG